MRPGWGLVGTGTPLLLGREALGSGSALFYLLSASEPGGIFLRLPAKFPPQPARVEFSGAAPPPAPALQVPSGAGPPIATHSAARQLNRGMGYRVRGGRRHASQPQPHRGEARRGEAQGRAGRALPWALQPGATEMARGGLRRAGGFAWKEGKRGRGSDPGVPSAKMLQDAAAARTAKRGVGNGERAGWDGGGAQPRRSKGKQGDVEAATHM